MGIDNQVARGISLEQVVPRIPPCRCCGKALGILDGISEAVREGAGIHTRCIPKHNGKHTHGINAARCQDTQNKERLARLSRLRSR
jgi:hypothetical protein